MCVSEGTQCARHVQVPVLGFRASRLVIYEQFVGVEKLSEDQGRTSSHAGGAAIHARTAAGA